MPFQITRNRWCVLQPATHYINDLCSILIKLNKQLIFCDRSLDKESTCLYLSLRFYLSPVRKQVPVLKRDGNLCVGPVVTYQKLIIVFSLTRRQIFLKNTWLGLYIDTVSAHTASHVNTIKKKLLNYRRKQSSCYQVTIYFLLILFYDILLYNFQPFFLCYSLLFPIQVCLKKCTYILCR